MHITGIICEYNPFHNGHRYHIEQTRKVTGCDVLICVMSGNFVQRGEPAIIDKWARTKAALEHHVDLVVELPFAYATQSAANFALGAVHTLHVAKVADIVFGSEINDVDMLSKLAHLDTSKYQDLMQEGLSPSKAYEMIYGAMNANDILGINYIKAMDAYDIRPYTIRRTNDYHDTSITSPIASATAIRQAVLAKEDVHHATCMAKQLDDTHTLAHYYPYLQYLLLSQSPIYLRTLFLMDEGIEQHLIKQARMYDDFASFLHGATCRRYSASRIRRTLLHLLHQTTKQEIDALPLPSHIRVLGFNDVGKQYLKQLKQDDVMIASRFNQIPLAYRNMEMKAAQIYGLLDQRKEMVEKEMQPPVYLR